LNVSFRSIQAHLWYHLTSKQCDTTHNVPLIASETWPTGWPTVSL